MWLPGGVTLVNTTIIELRLRNSNDINSDRKRTMRGTKDATIPVFMDTSAETRVFQTC